MTKGYRRRLLSASNRTPLTCDVSSTATSALARSAMFWTRTIIFPLRGPDFFPGKIITQPEEERGKGYIYTQRTSLPSSHPPIIMPTFDITIDRCLPLQQKLQDILISQE